MAKQKKKLSHKYVFRRLVLVVVVCVAVALTTFYVGRKVVGMIVEKASPAASSPTEPPQSVDPPPLPSSSEELMSTAPTVPVVPTVDFEAWNFILVNNRETLPENFEVELEVIVEDYAVDTRIADPLKRMIAAAKEDGVSLQICSAYRTIEYQEGLFNNSVAQYLASGKTEEEAYALTAEYYAVPGTSEHHTGLAVDIITPEYQVLDAGYANTPAAEWLKNNSYHYGFILRYPEDKEEITRIKFEPWHFRYVDVETATEITQSGLCLEEYLYLEELEQGTAEPVVPDDVSLEEPESSDSP